MTRRLYEYEGDRVKVTYDVGRCIHAAECVRTLPQVFDPQARPWVRPDNAEVAQVVETVRRCPTGALQAEWEGETTAVLGTTGENRVTIVPDGPLFARGDLQVVDAAGKEVVRDTRIALCRCGASKIKPFCDGTHSKVAFDDPGALAEARLQGEPDEPGTLAITVAKDGPLVVRGPLTVLAGAGEGRCSGSQGAICRCGASSHKPFCDGSHGPAGFSDG